MPEHALHHEVKIQAEFNRVQEALMTPEGLSGWTMAQVSGPVDGAWTLAYPDGPVFVWKVRAEQTARVVWDCVDGPGDAPGTRLQFDLSQLPDGRVKVVFAHDGWPHDAGNFKTCNALWGLLLHQLRGFAETGAPAPLLS
ncbi:SRPBCC domain-containing protein [Aquabacter spiritensis]|uniref:Activator of Hsp90 ATPase-like protein n=1 Tax=Aquabacter spiritensis TaxID=933073 RepID=A0A4R3M393_9HYPH|nr:SRPBCC domain-containing protein [Aquabacter spiritensis]TCT06699.1 activator of Hsp90 ATPase-like protein [Aquabacter spiritensis]